MDLTESTPQLGREPSHRFGSFDSLERGTKELESANEVVLRLVLFKRTFAISDQLLMNGTLIVRILQVLKADSIPPASKAAPMTASTTSALVWEKKIKTSSKVSFVIFSSCKERKKRAHLISDILELELSVGGHDGWSRDGEVVRIPGLDGEVSSVDVVRKTAVDAVLGEGSVGDDELPAIVEKVLVVSWSSDVAGERKKEGRKRVQRAAEEKRERKFEAFAQVGCRDVFESRVAWKIRREEQ